MSTYYFFFCLFLGSITMGRNSGNSQDENTNMVKVYKRDFLKHAFERHK